MTEQFKQGDKVLNQYGQRLTVRLQIGCQVWVVEQCFGWYHPAKLWMAKEAR